MMKLTRIVAIAFCTASFGAGALEAQNLREAQTPAEFPPASYSGAQYVDSKGCVYIRAGIDGNVTWVPRVNRQRKLICGQTPSLSADAAQTARTTPRQSASGSTVEQIDVPQQPATATPAATPSRTAAVSKPASTTSRRVPVVAEAAPQQPRTVAVRKPAQAPRQVVQAPAPATAAPVPAHTEVSPKTRVMPRHVYEARLTEDQDRVPAGYRAVWEDDRLNRRRAEQNLEGIARTRLIWTRTVPRRLIERSTGRDMTTRVPLVYPYTDLDEQQRDLGTVTLIMRNGQLVKRVERNKSRARKNVTPENRPAVRAAARSKAPTPSAKTGRYVQIGTFGMPSNAQAAAQRVLRAGLPARIGKLNRGGKSYQVVLAGPFGSATELKTGLSRSRAAGFRDAFVRR
jgi:sporulation related protein